MGDTLAPGTLLHAGTYRIVRFISRGGFGCTYEAEHILFGDRVAVKELYVSDFCHRDETTGLVTTMSPSKAHLTARILEKFIDEACARRHMSHPGIVRVTDVFKDFGTAYYIMDYIEGRSLNDMLKANGPMTEADALKYIRQVADALRYVHSQNRLHLDIKPGNIMVDTDDCAILIDFGSSKQYDEIDGENTSTLMGMTPGYAPPEQMARTVTRFLPATDIYALGATLYKLLTGKTPTDSSLRISGEDIEPLPEYISDATRSAIDAALTLNKTQRPRTIDAFLDLLDQPSEIQILKTEEADEVSDQLMTELKSKYDYVDKFSEGLAAVKLNGKCGFIDKNGREVIPLKYDDAVWFEGGLAAVKLNGKCGFIDKNGRDVIPLIYDDAWVFSEGLSCVKLNGKYGFIDKNGREVIPFKYDFAKSFSEGLAQVMLNGEWGFIDKTGREVIPFKYDFALSFSEGLAQVRQNSKYGFIDKTGREVIPLKYDDLVWFHEGLAQVKLNGKCGFIDKNGREVIPLIYDYAEWFWGGLAAVKLNGKYGFIDKNGREVIPLIYDYAGSFREGLARVILNGEKFQINRKGERID